RRADDALLNGRLAAGMWKTDRLVVEGWRLPQDEDSIISRRGSGTPRTEETIVASIKG
ncbi:hypothetical protein CY34DRAFT_814364, partial [Suillus luteus UH-Slu-Lm8-n1]